MPEVTEQETKKGLVTPETLRISRNLTIQAIPIEHTDKQWVTNQELLAREIRDSDGVIFEYFPGETKQFEHTPFLQGFSFFKAVEQESIRHHKDAYVFDPAHAWDFAIIRSVVPVAMVGGLLATAIASFETSLAANRKQTRRKFLSGFLTAASGVATLAATISSQALSETAVSHQSPIFPVPEITLRQVVISKGIANLGESLDKNPDTEPKNLVLIYPPAHWKGIKEFLQNREKLERYFRAYSQMKTVLPKGLKESFFSMRKYSRQEDSWQLAEKVEI